VGGGGGGQRGARASWHVPRYSWRRRVQAGPTLARTRSHHNTNLSSRGGPASGRGGWSSIGVDTPAAAGPSLRTTTTRLRVHHTDGEVNSTVFTS